MIICRQCGDHSEEGADFCSCCGSFLEFTGERVPDPEPATSTAAPAVQAPAPPPPSPAPSAPHGLIDRVRAAVRGEPGASEDEGEPVVAVTGTASPRRRAASSETPTDVGPSDAPMSVPAASVPGVGPPAAAAAPAPPPAPAGPLGRAAAAAPVPAPSPPAPGSPPRPAEQPPRAPVATTRPEDAGWPAPSATRTGAPAGPPDAADAPARPAPGSVPPPATPLAPPPAPAAPVAPAAPRPVAQAPAPPAPAARQPVAVQPAVVRERPAPRVAAAPPPPAARPDDIVCAQCGEHSARDRRFCRRCGASLTTSVAPPPPPPAPWWRRLLERMRGHRAGDVEGAATRRGPSLGRRLTEVWERRPALVALVGVALLVIGLNPTWRSAIASGASNAAQQVRLAVAPTFAPMRPREPAQANVAEPGHDANLVVDGRRDTYWAAPVDSPEGLPAVTISFANPVDFDKVGFTSGASDNVPEYQALLRPHDVRITLPDGSATVVHLNDVRSFQVFDVEAHQVSSVTLQIQSWYTTQPGNVVALSEVEFFQRQ
jgi:hypothetical protein